MFDGYWKVGNGNEMCDQLHGEALTQAGPAAAGRPGLSGRFEQAIECIIANDFV